MMDSLLRLRQKVKEISFGYQVAALTVVILSALLIIGILGKIVLTIVGLAVWLPAWLITTFYLVSQNQNAPKWADFYHWLTAPAAIVGVAIYALPTWTVWTLGIVIATALIIWTTVKVSREYDQKQKGSEQEEVS